MSIASFVRGLMVSFIIQQLDELYKRSLQSKNLTQRRQRPNRTAENQRSRYSIPIQLVGFQSRFQTAGSLIFKPPEQSSLAVNGTQSLTKSRRDSIKITISTTEPKGRAISKSKTISITQDYKKEQKENKANGNKKSQRQQKKKRKEFIINRFKQKIKEIPMGKTYFISGQATIHCLTPTKTLAGDKL